MSAPRQSRRSNRTILTESPALRQIGWARWRPWSAHPFSHPGSRSTSGAVMTQYPPPGDPTARLLPGLLPGPLPGLLPAPPGDSPALPPWGPPVQQPGVVPLRPLLFGGALQTVRRSPIEVVGEVCRPQLGGRRWPDRGASDRSSATRPVSCWPPGCTPTPPARTRPRRSESRACGSPTRSAGCPHRRGSPGRRAPRDRCGAGAGSRGHVVVVQGCIGGHCVLLGPWI